MLISNGSILIKFINRNWNTHTNEVSIPNSNYQINQENNLLPNIQFIKEIISKVTNQV